MDKINWPLHRDIPEYRWSDSSRYRPEVVEAMRAQGMKTIAHLQDRIKHMMTIDRVRKHFNLISADHHEINSILFDSGVPYAKLPFRVEGGGFRKMAKAIAFALEVDPVDLFGDPDAPENFVARRAYTGEMRSEKGARRKSNFRAYKPAVVQAMKEKGFTAFGDLVEAAYEGYRCERPDVTLRAFYVRVSSIISQNNLDRDRLAYRKTGYSLEAEAIANVLQTEPEALFGKRSREKVAADLSFHFDDIAHRDVIGEYDMAEWQERVSSLLSRLDSKKRDVIERRFGLNGYEPQTIENVGFVYGITHQGVSKIEGKVIGRLAHVPEVRKGVAGI